MKSLQLSFGVKILLLIFFCITTKSYCSSQLKNGPFKILASDEGGGTGNCKLFTDIETKIFSITISPPNLSPTSQSNSTDGECEFPMYLYAYWGNDFSNVLGISDPILFSDFTPLPNGLSQLYYPLQLDYSTLPYSICEGQSVPDIDIIVSLVYLDRELGFQPYQTTCPLLSSPNLIPFSHVYFFGRALCCEPEPDDDQSLIDDQSNINATASSKSLNSSPGQTKYSDRNNSDYFRLEETNSFPNPCNNYYNLSIKTFHHIKLKINIINIQGRIQDSFTTVLPRDQNILTIDTQTLPSGVYYIIAVSNTLTERIKIIKN